MKNKLAAVTLLICILGLTLTAAQMQRVSVRKSATAPKADKPLTSKRLFGVEAELFVQKLRETNPTFVAAQEKSAARLTAKGWKKTGITYVEIKGSPKPPKTKPGKAGVVASLFDSLFPQLRAAQPNEETAEGYLVSTGWDDGYDTNIEGNLYIGLYDGYDSWISIDTQTSIPWDGSLWYREWAGGDMGDRDHNTREVFFDEPQNFTRTPEGRVIRAKFQTGCQCVMFRRGGSAGCMLDQALNSSWSMCSAAVGWCTRRTWFATWACIEEFAGRACAVSFGAGMIGAVSQWFGNCRSAGLL